MPRLGASGIKLKTTCRFEDPRTLLNSSAVIEMSCSWSAVVNARATSPRSFTVVPAKSNNTSSIGGEHFCVIIAHMLRRKSFATKLISVVLLIAFHSLYLPAATRQPLHAKSGVVACTRELASQIGVDIMKQG